MSNDIKLDIPRYNQGFGGFGPLEACRTGKLMKADEVFAALLKQQQDDQNRQLDAIKQWHQTNLDQAMSEARYWKAKFNKMLCGAMLTGLALTIALGLSLSLRSV